MGEKESHHIGHLRCSALAAPSRNGDSLLAEALSSFTRAESAGPSPAAAMASTPELAKPCWLSLPPVTEVTSRVLNLLGCKGARGPKQDVLSKLLEGHPEDACMPDLDMLVLHIRADDVIASDGVHLCSPRKGHSYMRTLTIIAATAGVAVSTVDRLWTMPLASLVLVWLVKFSGDDACSHRFLVRLHGKRIVSILHFPACLLAHHLCPLNWCS